MMYTPAQLSREEKHVVENGAKKVKYLVIAQA